MVPPRPAAGRQPGAARGGRRRPGAAAVRARPRALGPGRAVPPRLPRRVAARARRPAPAAADPGCQVVRGDPVRRVVLAAKQVGAERVHVAADFGPYGAPPRRDGRARRSPTPASSWSAPGRRTPSRRAGSATARATPTRSSRRSAGPGPSTAGAARSTRPRRLGWLELDEDTTDIPDPALPDGLELPEAGEAAARRRWAEFLAGVGDYDDDRDEPGVDGTSRMSVHLK